MVLIRIPVIEDASEDDFRVGDFGHSRNGARKANVLFENSRTGFEIVDCFVRCQIRQNYHRSLFRTWEPSQDSRCGQVKGPDGSTIPSLFFIDILVFWGAHQHVDERLQFFLYSHAIAWHGNDSRQMEHSGQTLVTVRKASRFTGQNSYSAALDPGWTRSRVCIGQGCSQCILL